MNDVQPQGRSMQEIRAIVAEDTARWDELANLWNDLMPDEQQKVVDLAYKFAVANQAEEIEIDGSGHDPFTRMEDHQGS